MQTDWDNLTDNIYNKKCVLLLGPSLSFFKKRNRNVSLIEKLTRNILAYLNKKKISFEADQNSNLPYLMECYFANINSADSHKEVEKFISGLDSFCDGLAIPPLYTNIAALPFDTIISTSPDVILNKACTEAGFEYNFSAYKYRSVGATNKPAEENETSKRIRMIYNLCGSIKNGPDNIILNEQDQVKYLRHVIATGPPSNVLGRLDSEKSYLFLDFDFDDWQFKLLMEILNPQKGKANFLYAPKSRKDIKNINIEYFKKRFNIGYLDTDTISFVDELTKRYSAKYGDPLRKFKAYLGFEEGDQPHVTKLRALMKGQAIAKRVTFWDPSEIKLGGNKEEEIKNNFEESEIYIPLINYTFTGNDALKAQLDQAIALAKQGKKKIFPIIVGKVEYDKQFPELEANSVLILPRPENLPQDERAALGLNSRLKMTDEPESVYIEILKLINSEIK